MKRFAIISFALLYFLSVSGVAVNYFFCCGKFKEAYVFHCKSTPKNCKGNKLPGCCKTKTVFIKVKNDQAGSGQVKINPVQFSFNIFSAPIISIQPVFSFGHTSVITSAHAPPLTGMQPLYLAVNNFRI
jgi:hypothetical protein